MSTKILILLVASLCLTACTSDDQEQKKPQDDQANDVPIKQEQTAQTISPAYNCDYQTGWTADVIGGMGGRIIKVTNLNASGAGSLKEAIQATGPRIVVFEVGGVIDLNTSSLKIENPFITIAGQTAPSPGISIIRGKVRVNNNHDVVIQHLRIRPGTADQGIGWEPDGLTIYDSKRVIADHLSISWAIDENLTVSGVPEQGNTQQQWRENASSQISLTNNIVAEGLHYATHSNSPHSKGSLIADYTDEILIYKNLYASNHMRNPRFSQAARGAVINNFISNPGEKIMQYWQDEQVATGEQPEKGMISIVGNVIQGGMDTSADIGILESTDNVEVFFDDNIATTLDGQPIPLVRHWKNTSRVTTELIDNANIWPASLTAESAKTIQNSIWNDVGARPNDRDEIDLRIIEQAQNNTGSIIDYEQNVGGYPTHAQTQKAFTVEHWDGCMEYKGP